MWRRAETLAFTLRKKKEKKRVYTRATEAGRPTNKSKRKQNHTQQICTVLDRLLLRPAGEQRLTYGERQEKQPLSAKLTRGADGIMLVFPTNVIGR